MAENLTNVSIVVFSTEPLDEIMTLVIVHYTYFLYLVFTSKPENNVVIGLHEAAGPCEEREPVMTPFGHVSTSSLIYLFIYLFKVNVYTFKGYNPDKSVFTPLPFQNRGLFLYGKYLLPLLSELFPFWSKLSVSPFQKWGLLLKKEFTPSGKKFFP